MTPSLTWLVSAKLQELKRRHIKLVEEIGSGNFGSVWKAKLDHTDVPGGLTVAAKVLNTESDEATGELYKEAVVTAVLSGHANVVALLGVVTSGHPAMILVSYCEHGSLLSQLRRRAEMHDPFSGHAKMKFGMQICRGESPACSSDAAVQPRLTTPTWRSHVAERRGVARPPRPTLLERVACVCACRRWMPVWTGPGLT